MLYLTVMKLETLLEERLLLKKKKVKVITEC